MQNTVAAFCAEHSPDQGQNGINGGRHRLCRIWACTGGCGALWGSSTFSFGLEPVTATVDRNDLGVMKQAVEDGAGSRHIAEQFAPFFDRSIGSHHGLQDSINATRDLVKSLRDNVLDLLNQYSKLSSQKQFLDLEFADVQKAMDVVKNYDEGKMKAFAAALRKFEEEGEKVSLGVSLGDLQGGYQKAGGKTE